MVRLLAKTIWPPSGENVGWRSSAGLAATFTGIAAASASIFMMSPLPAAIWRVKVISRLAPMGDQAGWSPPSVVILTGSVPVGPARHRSPPEDHAIRPLSPGNVARASASVSMMATPTNTAPAPIFISVLNVRIYTPCGQPVFRSTPVEAVP